MRHRGHRGQRAARLRQEARKGGVGEAGAQVPRGGAREARGADGGVEGVIREGGRWAARSLRVFVERGGLLSWMMDDG